MEVITEKRGGREYDIPAVTLEELLETADFVSLHCPLTPETRGIIDKDSLARMKEGAFLINSSRGPLIVEQDLREALDNGVIAGAAVDVISEEPMREGNLLKEARNIIITPHIAWSAREARIRIMATTVENIESYLAGDVKNRVM